MQSINTVNISRDELVIRAAAPDDRAALEAIAAQIWDGNDYLPRALDTWFADPHDGFFVATVLERVVGVIKLTRFSPGEWWMEGLRVDPTFQGQGIARILHHYGINQLRQLGQGEVRFSTASRNEAIVRLAAETGFRRKAAYVALGCAPLRDAVQRLAVLGPADAARARAWLAGSDHFVRAQRSYEVSWTYYRLTDDRLDDLLAAGLVYGWPDASDPAQLAGLVIIAGADDTRYGSRDLLSIAYIDAAPEDLTALAQDVRRLATVEDRLRVRGKMLNYGPHLDALERAGFERDWDSEIWLYARDLNLTQHATVRTEMPPPVN